jgi:hypothetical protein
LSTHDILASAVASEIVRQVRARDPHWAVLNATVIQTSARNWPQPDFVIEENPSRGHAVAAEFKPPAQTKREYLTGLGQSVAYTRDFNHSLLIVPTTSDDNYQIAEHIHDVLRLPSAVSLPIGLVAYDPRTFSSTNATFNVLRALAPRVGPFTPSAVIDASFWAKWRDMSAQEMGVYLRHLYDESLRPAGGRTIRDRAFDHLWADIQAGRAVSWSGNVRHWANTPKMREAQSKNYRNFLMHIGWMQPDGSLTDEGLRTLHLVHQYTPASELFLNHLARAVLNEGKHMVLVNTINEFQEQRIAVAGEFPDEGTWLSELEQHLEKEGFLTRNPGRHGAAARNVARGFMKAEKTLWRQLGFIISHGKRVYHPGRGFIFDWRRITALLG